ncbi:Asp/Glu/hydantoin racemase [Nesterenkonia lacusekhoensis]|uniref:Asp/Glu/hydantoin racemase n=1 Tax=Nesterenkonia lacusekhoensis TaxID=150832 RepID=A0ABS4T2N7_9MICC|nr:Asp/Glu/hydantoin racemase [Nesterenkonia lacusekhoensis]
MRILVVNVNTTDSMTQAIAQQARGAAAEGTEIVPLTPRFGAESVEGNMESYLAAVGVMDAVASYGQDFDAVIQAGFGEHGREGLQELARHQWWTSLRPRRIWPPCWGGATPWSPRWTAPSH